MAVTKLTEIEGDILSLAETPHKGSRRDEIAPGLRTIPAGRKDAVVFRVDDDRREVPAYAIIYGGADWIRRSKARS